MTSQPRILVIAHGHPDFNKGGGEIAAYSLFREYAKHPDVREAFFLARIGKNRPALGGISLYGDHEYLWEQNLGNNFFMEGQNIYATVHIFASFLKVLKPDIVHLHHAVHLGYEIIQIIKKTLPQAKIYFTLHEYIPICHHSGQMITTSGEVCKKPSYEACTHCFPEFTVADFWQRKRRFQHFFSLIDKFIAPSKFLRQQYIDWGITPERIVMMENALRSMKPLPFSLKRELDRLIGRQSDKCRFGFFGQITPWKGVDILLQALTLLPKKTQKQFILEIHAANLEQQPKEYQERIKNLLKNIEESNMVQWIGSYDQDQIADRMAGIDWVIVPSIWYENSPVTIQEAFYYGRPVIASNLGGMAEKVHHDVDGLLVSPKNPSAWAETLAYACGNNKLWNKLHEGIQKPLTAAESTRAHLKMMGVILE